MRYYILVLFLQVLFTFSIKAQEERSKKFSIGIGGGMGFPLGDFKQSDEFYNSGFAKTGYTIPEINLGIVSTKIIGFTIKYSKSFFPVNENRISTEVSETYVESDPIKMDILLAGPTLNFLIDKFTFQFKVLTGISWAGYSEMSKVSTVFAGDTQNYGIEYPYEISSSTFHGTTNAFTTDLGISIFYSISKNISLFVSTDYVWSKHDHFPEITITGSGLNTGFGGHYPTEFRETKLAYQFIDTGLGIAFNF